MAAVSKSGTVSLATLTPPNSCKLSGLLAGESLAPGDACYIKTSDGRIYKSNGTAANAAAVVDGFVLDTCAAGDPVTLFWNVSLRYGASLSPGSFVYLATTAGLLVDAATTGGTVPIGRVVDATRIYVFKSY